MMRSTMLVLAAAAVISACSKQTPEQQIVADAANAFGGRSRVLAVKTIVIEGEGTNGNLGQDMTMEASTQAFVVTGYKRSVDLVNLRARTEQTRTPNFAYFQGTQAQKQVLGVDGDVGYNVAPNGNATRASNAVAKDRRADIYHHPLAIVRAGLDPGAKLAAMVRLWMTVYWQVPVPLHGAPQPVKVCPAAAVAVRVSDVYAR